MSELFQHTPGTTVWHRLPAGAKLLGLVAASIVVVALRGPVPAAVEVGVAFVLVMWSGPAGRRWRAMARLLRRLRGLLLVLVLLGAFHTWQHGWLRAVDVVGDLLTLVLLASVVTATTPVDRMLDAITWALGPLRPLGVHPGRVALAFSLTLRTIPLALALAAETRDAARARGLERNLRARLVPTVLRMVAHARLTGDALWARDVEELDESDRSDDRAGR